MKKRKKKKKNKISHPVKHGTIKILRKIFVFFQDSWKS